MLQIGIQADDLTGACDAGAPFAARGLATVVLLPDASHSPESAAVLVLDTESRGQNPVEAAALARRAAGRLAAQRPARLYKKVDSTLRGPLAAELAGVLEGTGLTRTLVAPAFPAQGRTVVDGILQVAGRPADQTPVARDPAFPPTGPSVLALLGRTGPHPVGTIPIETVRRGDAAVRARLDRWAGAFVADAETDTDLDVLAAAGDGGGVLLAGSAGLAAAVARRLPDRRANGAVRLPPPLLVVAGSAHPGTRAQIARLRARGIDGLWPDTDAIGGDAPDRQAIVRHLADATRVRVETTRPGTLLLTGGETAVAVCQALGATGLRLAGELERGLAVGWLLDGPLAGLTVVTKAGGFGDADTLVRVWEASA